MAAVSAAKTRLRMRGFLQNRYAAATCASALCLLLLAFSTPALEEPSNSHGRYSCFDHQIGRHGSEHFARAYGVILHYVTERCSEFGTTSPLVLTLPLFGVQETSWPLPQLVWYECDSNNSLHATHVAILSRYVACGSLVRLPSSAGSVCAVTSLQYVTELRCAVRSFSQLCWCWWWTLLCASAQCCGWVQLARMHRPITHNCCHKCYCKHTVRAYSSTPWSPRPPFGGPGCGADIHSSTAVWSCYW